MRDMLAGDFMIPPVVHTQSIIIYPHFGQANFIFQLDHSVSWSNSILWQSGWESTWVCYVIYKLVKDFFIRPSFSGSQWNALFLDTFMYTAQELLYSLTVGTIISWNDMVQKFTYKYFPPSKVFKLIHNISISNQLVFESFHEAWKRVTKEAYTSLLPTNRSAVDATSNSSITTMNIWEAYNCMREWHKLQRYCLFFF